MGNCNWYPGTSVVALFDQVVVVQNREAAIGVACRFVAVVPTVDSIEQRHRPDAGSALNTGDGVEIDCVAELARVAIRVFRFVCSGAG